MSNDEPKNQRGSSSEATRGEGQAGAGRKRRRRRRGNRSKKAERTGQPAAERSRPERSQAAAEPGDSSGGTRKRRRRRRRGGRSAEADSRTDQARELSSRQAGRQAERSAAEADAGDPAEPGKRRRRRRRRRGRREGDEAEPRRSDQAGFAAQPGAAEPEPAQAPGETTHRARAATDDEGASGQADTADIQDRDETDEELAAAARLPELPDAVEVREPEDDDPDPLTSGIEQLDDEQPPLSTGVHNVVGVKFASAGRIYLYDSGDRYYGRGEEVVVESDRGLRVGTVAVASAPKAPQRGRGRQGFKRVLRRPNRNDRRALERNSERSEHALRAARQAARELDLPIKVFRAEYAHSGKKVRVYFTAEERIDFRELVRRLNTELKSRVEMRQTGVRDEAKMVGGIGSCGRELCCTTWLPEFVPVSIKMAKDQGLVLNPTKVSGQCGRLKCCLVYEQATYAELRKGLPKLGKRVITEAGEGRVVEVDVLRQRVRVSLGPGEFQVFPGHEVKPMFPSQPQKKPRS